MARRRSHSVPHWSITALPRLLTLAFVLAASTAIAQTTTPAAQPAQPSQTPQAEPEQPHGQVLFERHIDSPAVIDTEPADTDAAQPAAPADAPASPQEESVPTITDAERGAERITAYDLDARITPAASSLAVRARLTVRNAGTAPLMHLVLQVSSSLIWRSVTMGAAHTPLELAQHRMDTDADHTGGATEAILTLPQPLLPGSSVVLDGFYDGTIKQDATRLTRIGALPAQAISTDWDEITGDDTSLRGFGNVLWYPVAAPALFLGDGAKLFDAIAAAKLRDEHATMRLHLAVEYKGEAPVAAYFCGRRQNLTALADDPDAPIAAGAGVASADFATSEIGFRLPSLFLVEHKEELIAPLPSMGSSSSSSGTPAAAAPEDAGGAPMLAVETDDEATLPRLGDSAKSIAPLMEQWFGPQPLSALTLLDHTGEPFEDGPLVVAPAATLGASSSSDALAHSMTHAWVQTGQPWMDEGLAQCMALLWVEHEQGREAMVAKLTDLLRPLALAEPSPTKAQVAAESTSGAETSTASGWKTGQAGQTIINTSEELYYRRKAAAVWLMLRGIVGDDALAASLTAWRMQPPSNDAPAVQAVAFERLLERTSHKDLGWFFRDWVLSDRGLPDLSIVDVVPRLLPAGKGHDSGWLVAVTVHNDGAAEVEVPVIIRSGTFSVTRRMRVPAFGDVTDRAIVEAQPTEVVVNDGITPETESSIHTRSVVYTPEP
jgi:hypothetical protein